MERTPAADSLIEELIGRAVAPGTTTPNSLTVAGLDAHALARLLWAYETVVALRPIGPGNRAYLQAHLRAARTLAERLAAQRPAAIQLATLVASQDPGNASTVAREIIARLRRLDPEVTRRTDPDGLYVVRPLSPLVGDYATMTVLFGPGLGLGDEITFLPFVRALAARFANLQPTVLSTYPGLWSALLPRAEVVTYRGAPLRPFALLEHRLHTGNAGRHLLVIADFDGYGLHNVLFQRRRNLDVLEIALGLARAWLRRGTSPWVEACDFTYTEVASNYWALSRFTAGLLGGEHRAAVWLSRRERVGPRSDNTCWRVLLNPLSSKTMLLDGAHWCRILRRVQALLPQPARLAVRVWPGVDTSSVAGALEILKSLARERNITVRLLTGASEALPTPHSAISILIGALDQFDLCLTVDTFTAHLTPLFGVPTVVIPLRDNVEFWVPSPLAFYLPLMEVERHGPLLIAEVLRAPEISAAGRHAARALQDASEAAARTPDGAAKPEGVVVALRRYLDAAVEPVRQDDGRRWQRFWTLLTTALHREPIEAERLAPLIFRWENSEFFKLARLRAVERC